MLQAGGVHYAGSRKRGTKAPLATTSRKRGPAAGVALSIILPHALSCMLGLTMYLFCRYILRCVDCDQAMFPALCTTCNRHSNSGTEPLARIDWLQLRSHRYLCVTGSQTPIGGGGFIVDSDDEAQAAPQVSRAGRRRLVGVSQRSGLPLSSQAGTSQLTSKSWGAPQ